MDLLRQDYKVQNNNVAAHCQKVLQSKHAPLCQHYLKKGQTSTPHRRFLWSFVLGSHVQKHVSYLIYFTIVHNWNSIERTWSTGKN